MIISQLIHYKKLLKFENHKYRRMYIHIYFINIKLYLVFQLFIILLTMQF